MTSSYPRVLHVDTTYAPPQYRRTLAWDATLDLKVYARAPQWWRKIEMLLRLDLLLAFKAKQMAREFDVILAGSERVGIPLAALGLEQPIVTTVYHMGSRYKKRLLRPLGLHRRWQRIGCPSSADQKLMEEFYSVPPEKLFPYVLAPMECFTPGGVVTDGPIISAGVSKRDYRTLLRALSRVPGCYTEIYATSRYPEAYTNGTGRSVPAWVSFKDFVPPAALAKHYRRARFVVLPLTDTTQFSAGASVALEAHATGKAVIATRTKGMADYVVDGVTGVLVPPGDVEALAQAIDELWANPERAHQMGLAGRRYVEANFDRDSAYEALRCVLAKVHSEAMARRVKAGKSPLEAVRKDLAK